MDGKARTALSTVGVIIVMGALGFLAVPAYNMFCKVTGFGGTTGVAETGSDVVLDRTIKVRFDGSLDRDMPWQFKPVQNEMEFRIGETAIAFYEAYNPTDRTIAGTATYNVTPYSAGGYFDKIDCFCFTMQVLKPHERVQMPVTFYVDPAIVDDPEAKYLHTITLSYTFYETDLPDEQAELTTTTTSQSSVN
jgi:cytochrome c oxidase assembly protein subunit 11